MMRKATLVLIIQDGKVFLGEKKKGEIGTGNLNGPGGKMDPEDNDSHIACLIRETKEEWDIELDPSDLMLQAVIVFYAGDEPSFEVYVYRTTKFVGELKETPDTWKPEPYAFDEIPYERMLEADRAWFPTFLEGKKFRANVRYKSKARDFESVEFLEPDF